MCEYIKDDGEQCGIDTHDGAFCHQHEDSPQARIYQTALTAAQSESTFGTMERTCSSCGTTLRRTERLQEHPDHPEWMLFEAVVECDCAEHVLGGQQVRAEELSEGWC